MIIYCTCGYYPIISNQVKEKVLEALKNTDAEFEAVSDLCRMCAERDPALQRWVQSDSIKIIACYPRAIKWLFHAAGAPLPSEGVEILNMRCLSAEAIIAALPQNSTSKGQGTIRLEKTGDWVPWFPVIDYDRCVNCMQCLNFCLFGTFELSEEGQVQVKNPANCKTNCPACANACPQRAIIFPKYGDSPVNGDEVREDRMPGERKEMNITELSKVNIYDAIRRRSQTGARFSKNEQQTDGVQNISTIKQMQKELNIPSDVLAALSPTEIAKIKAKATKRAGAKGQRDSQRQGGREGYPHND
ncbi:MAG: hypothetical protein JXM79_09280 [Sedimentisphaerales bacterium]|nr:hypothetical protein [Sedimentisphaerales bacterium]